MSIITSLTRFRDQTGNMTLMDHVEDLRWHIIRSVAVVIVASIIVFFNIEWIFHNILLGPSRADFISYKALCTLGMMIHTDALCFGSFEIAFQNTELSGQFMMSFSVSLIIGFIVSFPYVAWELWSFIKPALTTKEIARARGLVFSMSLLFFTGVLFAYFVIVPFTIQFFATYQLSPQFKNIITISNYYDTLSDLVLGMGIVFELPVAVYFLSRVGFLTPEIMKKYYKFAILIIMLLAAVITPPDWLSIWLVAIPLGLLYQLSIGISGRVQRSAKQ
ncbi:MAG TPA: twin-arginine translocase subunit TatC [Chitinophagaceae bacterium]|nr:twin-arginine translocase subunit TatC [Chitinophagaceae bacterium]